MISKGKQLLLSKATVCQHQQCQAKVGHQKHHQYLIKTEVKQCPLAAPASMADRYYLVEEETTKQTDPRFIKTEQSPVFRLDAHTFHNSLETLDQLGLDMP